MPKPDKEAIRIDITPGTLYEYHHGGTYVMIGVGMNVHSKQEMVAYQSVDGRDQGKLFFCTLWDFSWRFRKVLKPNLLVKPNTTKVAGLFQKGSDF